MALAPVGGTTSPGCAASSCDDELDAMIVWCQLFCQQGHFDRSKAEGRHRLHALQDPATCLRRCGPIAYSPRRSSMPDTQTSSRPIRRRRWSGWVSCRVARWCTGQQPARLGCTNSSAEGSVSCNCATRSGSAGGGGRCAGLSARVSMMGWRGAPVAQVAARSAKVPFRRVTLVAKDLRRGAALR